MEKLYGQVNYHEFDPLNGVAMNDAWAIPNLVLGGKALTTGTGALITNAPYSFGKRYKMMKNKTKNE